MVKNGIKMTYAVVVVVVIAWGINRVFVCFGERLSDPPKRGCALGSMYRIQFVDTCVFPMSFGAGG